MGWSATRIGVGWLFVAILTMIALPAKADSPPESGLQFIDAKQGQLVVTLVAAPMHVALGETGFDGAAFNGDYAAPVLRAHPGDLMKITLVNHLPVATNLHFHGLIAGPRANGDNVHLVVAPGDQFHYLVRIPADQPPGLYWYHPHIHGSTQAQTMDGLSGAIVVEGLQAEIPALAGLPERILILKDRVFDETTDPVIDQQFHRILQTVNGQLLAHWTMAAGGSELWQISNQSSDRFFHLAIPGLHFRVLAEDGIVRTEEALRDSLDIAPAKRFAVLVSAGTVGTQYSLISQRVATGVGDNYSLNRPLAEITVVPASTGTAPPPDVMANLPAPDDLRTAPIAATRTLIYTESSDSERFFINGKMFDHKRIDIRVPLGSVEEWTVRNDTDDLHTFHIHQTHFQVVARNGVAEPYVGQLDTVVIPERTSVTIRIPFLRRDILGRFMYHCHMLEHEDKGMMGQIEVYDPKNDGPLRNLWRRSIETVQDWFPDLTICHIAD